MENKLASLKAYQILDSKGYPTLYGELTLADGKMVATSVGNTLHGGKYASEYLYDGGDAYEGRGVTRSIKYVNELIAPKLTGVDVSRYKDVDLWLLKADPSENKETLGANTTLLISQLVYKAAALVSGMPLYQFLHKAYTEHFDKSVLLKRIPSPIFTMISGGKHGAEALSFQEFSIVLSTGLSFSNALKMGVEMHHELNNVLRYRNIFAGFGDDGGYVPNLSSNIDALEIVKETMIKQDLKLGVDIFFALDLASDFVFRGGKYYVGSESLDTKGFFEYIEKLFKEYRALIIEDAFQSDDVAGWRMLEAAFGERVYLLGDDMIATNKKRLEKAVRDKLCNMANVKLYQRGTVWEVMEVASGARKAGMKVAVAQSGLETNDDFLADFAVALQADFIKFGAPVRGERVAKYNRLLAIERELLPHG